MYAASRGTQRRVACGFPSGLPFPQDRPCGRVALAAFQAQVPLAVGQDVESRGPGQVPKGRTAEVIDVLGIEEIERDERVDGIPFSVRNLDIADAVVREHIPHREQRRADVDQVLDHVRKDHDVVRRTGRQRTPQVGEHALMAREAMPPDPFDAGERRVHPGEVAEAVTGQRKQQAAAGATDVQERGWRRREARAGAR